MGTAQGRSDARLACYKLFRDDDPTGHAEFLCIWSETEALAEGSNLKTAAQWGRIFKKHVTEAQKLVSYLFRCYFIHHLIQIRL